MLKKNNIYLLVLVLLLVLSGLRFVYRMQKINSLNSKKPEFKNITPQCVLGALTSNKNILIVNVLSEKMPIYIGYKNPQNQKSISKQVFESMLQNNGGQIPKDVDGVILMCAAWSCGAGKSYFEELITRKVNVDKVVDYAGGIHEWCLYHRLNNDIKVFNLQDNSELQSNELNELLKNTAHSYKNNTLMKSEDKVVAELCSVGQELPNLL